VLGLLVSPATARALADGVSYALPFIALAVGYLMVSTVRYVHVPNRYLRGKKSIRKIARMLFMGIVLFAIFPEVGLALAFLGYAASGPIGVALARVRGEPPAAAPAAPPPQPPAPMQA